VIGSRARLVPIARRPWPLLALAATFVGVWLGLQAPAVSPVAPAALPVSAEAPGVVDPFDVSDGAGGGDGTGARAGRDGDVGRGDRGGRGGRGGGGR
jgi:uncharacterized membrane protein YgcG